MMTVLQILIGMSAGVVVAGGIFAFLVVIGIIPRLVQHTKTARYILLYETVISAGGVLAGLTMLGDRLLTGAFWLELIVGLGYGMFVGCLCVAIAEVLDVIPILCRRAKLAKDLPWLLLILGLGKTVGVLIYYFIPGFLVF